MQYFTLKVVNVIKPVADVVTICFKQPGLKKVKYKAGQYLTLVVKIGGRKYIRPYSLSSAPGIDPLLEVTIKRIPGGIVSNYLYDHVKVDDVIEVIEPMGEFVYNPTVDNAPKNIMLWGAGSGITPLMSILKTALITAPDSIIHLFYCNRNPEHVIFQQEISRLKQKHPDNLIVWNFYTGIPEDIYLNYQVAGRITDEKIFSILSDSTLLLGAVHYICGPQGLKDTITNVLSKVGTPQQNVYTEEFEVLIDPEQFDDIETQTVKINFAGLEQAVEVIKGKSILDAGLDAGLDLSYSCQTGTCTLCKAKLVHGSVKRIGVEKLPDDITPDECLLCCSYPYTNDIQLTVN